MIQTLVQELTDNDFLGLGASVVFLIIFLFTVKSDKRLAFLLSNCVLAACGGLTVGFSFNSFENTLYEQIFDVVAGLFVMISALNSLYTNSKEPLAIGYLFHAIWDIFHHDILALSFGVGTLTPLWYPFFCASYDLGVAVYYLFIASPTGHYLNESKKKTK